MFCIFSHTVLDELQFHLYMPRFISEKWDGAQRYLERLSGEEFLQ
jgi:hypothetical protein